jgi:membrane-bound serine protease (ClpP class)
MRRTAIKVPSHRRTMRSRWRAAGPVIALVGATLMMPTDAAPAGRALVLEIDGAIGPAIADYVVREFQQVTPANTHLVILRMNTPGGLDTSMRAITRTILSSPVAVATYVAPNGARAASASFRHLCEQCPQRTPVPGKPT